MLVLLLREGWYAQKMTVVLDWEESGKTSYQTRSFGWRHMNENGFLQKDETVLNLGQPEVSKEVLLHTLFP